MKVNNENLKNIHEDEWKWNSSTCKNRKRKCERGEVEKNIGSRVNEEGRIGRIDHVEIDEISGLC